ncbi:hypothetical protein, partial [Pseudomonas savastanoi]
LQRCRPFFFCSTYNSTYKSLPETDYEAWIWSAIAEGWIENTKRFSQLNVEKKPMQWDTGFTIRLGGISENLAVYVLQVLAYKFSNTTELLTGQLRRDGLGSNNE